MTCQLCMAQSVVSMRGRSLCLTCANAVEIGRSEGHAAGYEAAVRDMWRGVCEQRARRHLRRAREYEANARGCLDLAVARGDNDLGKFAADERSRGADERHNASVYRAWAREGA